MNVIIGGCFYLATLLNVSLWESFADLPPVASWMSSKYHERQFGCCGGDWVVPMENATSYLCFDSITTAKYSKVQYSAVLIWKSHHRGCGRRYQHKFRISKEMNITTCNYILIVLVLNFTAFDFGWDEESVLPVLVSKGVSCYWCNFKKTWWYPRKRH